MYLLIRKSLGGIASVARAQIVQTASETKEGLMSGVVSDRRVPPQSDKIKPTVRVGERLVDWLIDLLRVTKIAGR